MNRVMKEYTKELRMDSQLWWNCYGFATHKADWRTVSDRDEDNNGDFKYPEDYLYEEDKYEYECEFLEYGYERDEIEDMYQKSLDMGAENILRSNPELTRIDNEFAAGPHMDVIAFRVSYDDFHFARKMPDGRWYHKMGGNRVTRAAGFDSIWREDEMNCAYLSRTVYFSAPRNYNK